MINAPTLTHLESEINKVRDWMIANKLTLNTSKSNPLIINPKQNAAQYELSINSKPGIIRSVYQAKYLGVILDSNLNFRKAIEIVGNQNCSSSWHIIQTKIFTT